RTASNQDGILFGRLPVSRVEGLNHRIEVVGVKSYDDCGKSFIVKEKSDALDRPTSNCLFEIVPLRADLVRKSAFERLAGPSTSRDVKFTIERAQLDALEIKGFLRIGGCGHQKH